MAKKKKKTVKGKTDEYFVSVNDPSHVRLSILESRKSVLESMRILERTKHVREQKISQKKVLRSQLRQINGLLSKIKRSMPVVKLPDKDVIKAPVAKKVAVPKPKKHIRTELDKIEESLRDIESKISTLG